LKFLESEATSKVTKKRKADQLLQPAANQLTNFFSPTHEKKEADPIAESKENTDTVQPILKKQKKRKGDQEGSLSQPATQDKKITIFLKKDQNAINSTPSNLTTSEKLEVEKAASKSKETKPKVVVSSQSTLKFKKSPSKSATQRTSPPVVIPKTSIGDFYKKVGEIYDKEELPLLKELINKINEDLKKRFNVKKVERFFHTCMKQFLRGSPDQLWDSVYKPANPLEVSYTLTISENYE